MGRRLKQVWPWQGHQTGTTKSPFRRLRDFSEPSVVEPAFGQPGGGTEMTTGNPINVGGIPFRTFGGG